MSLKSLCVILHLLLRMYFKVGWHSTYLSMKGIVPSVGSLFRLGVSVLFLSFFVMDARTLKICLGYPRLLKCLIIFFLYRLLMAGDVVLRITLVISPMAIPLCMCVGM